MADPDTGAHRAWRETTPAAARPRVVHLVPALFGDGGITGGAERYALELARHMAPRVPTTLLSFGAADRVTHDGALTVRVLGGARHVRGDRTNPVSLRLPLALRGADVVHCHQQHVLSSSMAAAWSRLTGRRVFVSDLGGGGWDISGYVSTDSWYHGHLHISEYSRRNSRHEARADARVILGGVDLGKFRPPVARVPGGRVLFVGRVLPHKGVDVLVRALPPGLGLDIIGREVRADYAAHLRELARGKDVRFRHDCTDADIVRAYQDALCIVLPSVYDAWGGGRTLIPELLGQTLLEGMACGAPGVCNDVASMPEVVRHEVTGFVVPPNDPAALGARLQALADDPALAARLGAAARADMEARFSWDVVVDRCLAAYAGAPA